MKKWLLKIAKAIVEKYDTKPTERFLGYVDKQKYVPQQITYAQTVSIHDQYALNHIDHVKHCAAVRIAEQLIADDAVKIATFYEPNGDVRYNYTLWYIKK